MSKPDLKVIEALAEELETTVSDSLIYALVNEDTYYTSNATGADDDEIDKILEAYNYELLEEESSGEGGGEYCYGIFKLKDKFYKAEYSYYSSTGHDYDGILDTLEEVKPVEKLVTVYVSVEE